jgi:uncharacterized alpha-E superfamily protein
LTEYLLSRYADCLFWLARYMERAENLARILDVNATFSRDSRGGQNWRSIVELNSDLETFFALHAEATEATVLDFYVTSRQNPTSLISTIANARENARTLRPVISTEMWAQMNVFHNRIAELDARALEPGNLSALFGSIKEAVQAHTGITDGTLYRDQGWYFYQLGRVVERADQTTRIVDIKYHLLLPSVEDVGSPIDISQWSALLRSAAGYHAFRRLHSAHMTPGRIAGFLLLNPQFPRSVAYCVQQAEQLLIELKSRYALRGGNDAAEELDRLRAVLGTLRIEEILREGLHEFLDLIQRQLTAVTRELGVAFFGWPQETMAA